jgi:hypothetical protein
MAQEALLVNIPLDQKLHFSDGEGKTKVYDISFFLFQCFSPRITEEAERSLGQPLTIQEPVSLENFDLWVKACQYRDIEINLRNACDLRYLSQAWETVIIANDVDVWINDHRLEMIVPTILWNMKHRYATQKEEMDLRKNFTEFFGREDILDLPIHLVDRTMMRAGPFTGDQAMVSFLKKAFRKWRAEASRLCAAVDLGAVSDVDLMELNGLGFNNEILKQAMGEPAFAIKMKVEQAARTRRT